MINIKKILLANVILLVLIGSGCNKKRCYNCYAFSGYFKASKNVDTLRSGGYSASQYNDSLNYYTSIGYIIDTQFTITTSGRFCDTNQAYHGQPVRDSCVVII